MRKWWRRRQKGTRLPAWMVGSIIVPTPEWITEDVPDDVKQERVKQFEPAPMPPAQFDVEMSFTEPSTATPDVAGPGASGGAESRS